jgi:GTP-binding protein
MIFYVNTSPFAGQDGKYLTSRHILARLDKEMRLNVALQIEQIKGRADAFEVRGRGELQMAVLIETMRREGYEFMVSKPRVITKEIDGKVSEPVEMLYLDIPEDFVGVMSEKLSIRKGRMVNIINHGSGRVNLEFRIPSRGLIGFRTTFMTDTKGAGVMNTIMEGYEPWFGPIPQRNTGALVSDRPGKVTAYASLSMEDRGELQIEVGTHVYGGMVIGERNRPGDLDVNITREKKLTNMRSANADATVTLRKPHLMTLDESIEFISENELVEITPDNIRIRKMELDPQKRLSQMRKEKRIDD